MKLKVITSELKNTANNHGVGLHTDGVIGCQLPSGFVEESNFYISEVKMKIKVKGKEAGWIVAVSDVTSEETNQ